MGEDGGCWTADDWSTKEWPVGWLISEYDRESEEDEDVEESGMSQIQSHEYMHDHNIEIYRTKTQCRLDGCGCCTLCNM